MSNMREILMAEVAAKGTISFARFMELALYCPKFGYYEQMKVAPGHSGDFYTSVSVGEMFGELLARQFAEWLRNAKLPKGDKAALGWRGKSWQILEAGAHDGRLAGDILRWLKANESAVFAGLEYWILEPSAVRRKSQETTLAEFAGRVRWFATWEEVPESGVNGIIFANELLDALPVQRVGWDAAKRKWFEWGVTVDGEKFGWARMPGEVDSTFLYSALYPSGRTTPHSALDGLWAVLPDGFTTEVCLAAVGWWRAAARKLKSGKLITFDYGLAAEQFFTPERTDGTLRAYYQHHQEKDVLARPGEQDITAQVNFSAIRDAGEAEGLKTKAWTSQGQFLTSVVERAVGKGELLQEWTAARKRQFQTLTHPEHLGRVFQVLAQAR